MKTKKTKKKPRVVIERFAVIAPSGFALGHTVAHDEGGALNKLMSGIGRWPWMQSVGYTLGRVRIVPISPSKKKTKKKS